MEAPMKNLLSASALLIIAIIFSAAPAQQSIRSAKISGIVEDDPYPSKRMPKPIQDAHILLLEQLQITYSEETSIASHQAIDSTTTDQAGKFSFPSVPAGNYKISVSHSQFKSRQINCSVQNDTSLIFYLLPNNAHASLNGKVWISCPFSYEVSDCTYCVRQPAPGCTVTVYSNASGIQTGYNAAQISYSIAAVALCKTITDTSGQYSIDSVPMSSANGEKVQIVTTKARYISQRVDTALWNTQSTQFNFTLAPQMPQNDTVLFLPEKPTIKDSVTFHLFNAGACCCMAYHDNGVLLTDTIIDLAYSADNSLCQVCRCSKPGSWTEFRTGPLAAGRYGIYKVQSPYCKPGTMCPDYLPAPVRVGNLTVSNSTLVSGPKVQLFTGEFSVRWASDNNSLFIMVPQAGPVEIRMYSLRGELLATPIKKMLPACQNRVRLDGLSPGSACSKPIIIAVWAGKKSVFSKMVPISQGKQHQ
jgi:hypothetical protein